MSILRDRTVELFRNAFGTSPDLIARGPGRVNLIGEHTDYNDGFVLPAAIGVHTLVAARRRDDDIVNVIAADFGGARSSFSLDAPIKKSADQRWSDYVRGVIVAMQRSGLSISGADMVVTGNIPKGSGLSSSASLAVATGVALRELNALSQIDNTGIALLAQRSECEFAGINCGIMDQLASAHGKEGHALLIDCRSLVCRPIAVPQDAAILIVHSGIVRGLVEGAYNQRRAQCEGVVRLLGVSALRDVSIEQLDQNRVSLDPLAYRRARHVVTENSRTLEAGEALLAAQFRKLGELMAASHVSMRDDFEITLPAIDALVRDLQQAIGDEGGARMTGGGFGGAVVAVLKETALDQVVDHVRRCYRTPDGSTPLIMIEKASAGASIL